MKNKKIRFSTPLNLTTVCPWHLADGNTEEFGWGPQDDKVSY